MKKQVSKVCVRQKGLLKTLTDQMVSKYLIPEFECMIPFAMANCNTTKNNDSLAYRTT